MIISALAAVVAQNIYGDDSQIRVYRNTHHIPLSPDIPPVLSVATAGMPVEISLWDGGDIKVEVVSELPLIIEDVFVPYISHDIKITQDDGFAISFFTFALFRYNLKIYLPRWSEYERVSIISSGGDIVLNAYHLRVSETVSIETNNGDISVIRGTNEYRIKTRSGDVFMDFDFLVSRVVISSKQGNINLRIPDTSLWRAEELLDVWSESGEVNIDKKDTSLSENTPLL
jgi:hypothetical protein